LSVFLRDRQCNGLELQDTKGVIRSRKSKKDRQYNGLELEDTKGAIRSRKSKKDRQYNCLELEDTKGVIRSRKSKDRQYTDLEASRKLFKISVLGLAIC
jgi:uncharacterized protein involved in type VI secretion and phage assembly